MKAMLSIKPEYVERIMSGEKRYEFRRRTFKRDDVDAIVIYETSPVQMVVGEAEVTGILAADPATLWERTGDKAGISYEDFMDYYRGRTIGYAITPRRDQTVSRSPAVV